jgi:oxygen-independent coproporphyrinogen-3 oxidase
VGARHLYVHLPFCSSRCGYCDFVTVVGRDDQHGAYVDAVLREIELEHRQLDDQIETIFLGGGTPTFVRPAALERLLAALPACDELTVEANPETVTPELASLLREGCVDRVSLGVQSFRTHLLETLDREAGPADARRAFATLREAGFENLSLDLIYGIPGQTRADLEHDLEQALALDPEHVSAYELEAKPGTRFAHAHGEELQAQADAMEEYFELVVAGLTGAGYRWYETANFCRLGERDLRARHNLGYWLGHDYLGVGVGAVSTLDGRRIRNLPSLRRYLNALANRERPPREVEELPAPVRAAERVLLGLRLDEPLDVSGLESALDSLELDRLSGLGLVTRNGRLLALTERGRFLGGGVAARLLA